MSSPCGYDKNTGIFTVKTPGLYLFAITVTTATSSTTSVQIRVDQQNKCHTYSYHSSGRNEDTHTCTTIQDLKVGQKVDVYLRTGSLTYFFGEAFPSNQFQGVLLR